MHEVKAERCGELFVKNKLILQHHWTWKQLIDIGKKNYSQNFWKFPERLEYEIYSISDYISVHADHAIDKQISSK